MLHADRFDTHVQPEPMSGCHLWLGADDGDLGYGSVRIHGRNVKAHRAAWERERGPIPAGLFVLHRCDTPACVNVEHLWLGTHEDNMADMAAKGRTRCGGVEMCPAGHPYDEPNTRRYRGGRHCRACDRARNARGDRHRSRRR